MATTKRFGMLDCLTWDRTGGSSRVQGEVWDVKRLLLLRDALRANEPAPLDAACWMADAIDQIIQEGGSLDKRLGLKRRGKPSVKQTASITRRDALFRSLAARIPENHTNKLAEAVLAMLAGQIAPPDSAAADALSELRQFKNLPHSSRHVMRILSARVR